MENAKALCSAIVLQAVKDYTAVTRRLKKLTKALCDVRDRQAEVAIEKFKARRTFIARNAFMPWQARLYITRQQKQQTAILREEVEALKTELVECEKILKFDLVPFFKSDWCNDISPIDGKKMLTQLKYGR